MKEYFINVHYDAVVHVRVKASDKKTAIEIAKSAAGKMPIDDYFYTDSCVTEVRDIDVKES